MPQDRKKKDGPRQRRIWKKKQQEASEKTKSLVLKKGDHKEEGEDA